MIKKLRFPILIVIIVLQLLTAISMIAYGVGIDKLVENKGKEYKIEIKIESIYNGEVDYRVKFNDGYYQSYSSVDSCVEIITDENGMSSLMYAHGIDKPDDYINISSEKSFPNYCTYDTGKGFYSRNLSRNDIEEMTDCYVTVNVYKGHANVTGLYIYGVKIEDYIGEEPVNDDIVDFENYDVFDESDDFVEFD